jgi:hypothetical protein
MSDPRDVETAIDAKAEPRIEIAADVKDDSSSDDPDTGPVGRDPGLATGKDPDTGPVGRDPGLATGKDPDTGPVGRDPGLATGKDPDNMPDNEGLGAGMASAQDPSTISGSEDDDLEDLEVQRRTVRGGDAEATPAPAAGTGPDFVAGVRGDPGSPPVDEGIIVVDSGRPAAGFGDIRPGETISITGINDRFSGNALVTGERHDIGATTWATGDEIFGSWSTTNQPGIADSPPTAIRGDAAASMAEMSVGQDPRTISEDKNWGDRQAPGTVGLEGLGIGPDAGGMPDVGITWNAQDRTPAGAPLDASAAGVSAGRDPSTISGSEDDDLEDLEVQRRTVRGGDTEAPMSSATGAGVGGSDEPRTTDAAMGGLSFDAGSSAAGAIAGRDPSTVSGQEDDDLEDLEVQRRTVRGGDTEAPLVSATGSGDEFDVGGVAGPAGSSTDEGIIIPDVDRQAPRTVGLEGSAGTSTAGMSAAGDPSTISGGDDDDLDELEVERRTVRGGDTEAPTVSATSAGVGGADEPRTTDAAAGDGGDAMADVSAAHDPNTVGGRNDPSIRPALADDFSTSIMGGLDAPVETSGLDAAPTVSMDLAAAAPAGAEAQLPPTDQDEMKIGSVAHGDAAAGGFDLAGQEAPLEMAPAALEAPQMDQPAFEVDSAAFEAPQMDQPAFEQVDPRPVWEESGPDPSDIGSLGAGN